jgi:tetratricopeptide (TPR) repeat protein
MKKAISILLLMVAFPWAVYAGSGDFQKAMQLFQRHHYDDAALLMYSQLAGKAPGEPYDTRHGFGLVCLTNARFYDRLQQAAKPLQVEYLRRLVQADDQRSSATSRLVKLYLGKALLAAGRPAPAITALSQFLEIPDSIETDRYEARIALGTAYHAAGQEDRAAQIWSKLPENVPHAAALLASAYQQTGMHTDKITALAENAAGAFLMTKEPIPVQCASALLDIYGRRNRIRRGFEILARTQLETFAREEVIGAHKVLRFYDSGLLRHLSDFYNQAAIDAFNHAKKSTNPRISLTASFLAAEAYAFSRCMDKASRTLDELLAAAPPKAISLRARVRQLAYDRNAHNPKAPLKGLDAFLSEKSTVAQVSDIVLLCAQLGIDCPEVLKRATALWQQAKGRPPASLGMALGRYYRTRRDHTRTLHYLEAARDKSRKNRIEANPPAMLADLAWAYYKNRQFSEALEIYFTMSKQFPAVRQIQVALQGIYSMEQQSAGDAKIF